MNHQPFDPTDERGPRERDSGMTTNQPPGSAAPDAGSAAPADDPDQAASTANPRTGAVPGADSVYLWVGDSTVALRCHLHPDFTESHAYGMDGEVPAAWMVGVLAGHLAEHAADSAEDPADEEPSDEEPATTASALDEFGREVAVRCRWALVYNEGDPDDAWSIPYRLAVALVLGNHLYLRSMGDGPGYSPQDAMLLLYSGMTHSPPDIGAWIGAIRAEISGPRGLLVAPPGLRSRD
jgi:hypothetical protein